MQAKHQAKLTTTARTTVNFSLFEADYKQDIIIQLRPNAAIAKLSQGECAGWQTQACDVVFDLRSIIPHTKLPFKTRKQFKQKIHLHAVPMLRQTPLHGHLRSSIRSSAARCLCSEQHVSHASPSHHMHRSCSPPSHEDGLGCPSSSHAPATFARSRLHHLRQHRRRSRYRQGLPLAVTAQH
jgi:hypothetical protein